jgi:hypothetical protein
MKDGSPTKELLLSPQKSLEKSPEKDILGSLPRVPLSRPQSQLSNYAERYRSATRTPSSSRRLTFGRPKSRQSDIDMEEDGDVTITLERTANITPRASHRINNHHRTISSTSRPSSRLSTFSLDHDDQDPVFRTPSATGRRQSGILPPSERRQSGIPAPRRQSGIPARPSSPTRSTSSSSFHSDTIQITSPSTSNGSMGAPTMAAPSLKAAIARRQSGAQTALPVPKSSLPMAGRKSLGTGIPVPR